jgi:hypothetical protein
MYFPQRKLHAIVATVTERTPQQARAALAEAARQATRVRSADAQYRPILLGLAATYLAAGVLVGMFPRGGSIVAGVGLLLILVAGLIGGVGLLWRIRIYSRWGPVRFAWSCAAFTIWNAAVVGVSSATGWWGPHQPGVHFTVSAAVAALPLLLAAWLVGRRR